MPESGNWNHVANGVQWGYMDMTLGETNTTPIACACAGCSNRQCRVCFCAHSRRQQETLTRAAHIAVKLMADLLAKRQAES